MFEAGGNDAKDVCCSANSTKNSEKNGNKEDLHRKRFILTGLLGSLEYLLNKFKAFKKNGNNTIKQVAEEKSLSGQITEFHGYLSKILIETERLLEKRYCNSCAEQSKLKDIHFIDKNEILARISDIDALKKSNVELRETLAKIIQKLELMGVTEDLKITKKELEDK